MTHAEKLHLAQEAVDRGAPMASKGLFRQKYHFMAPSGWLNDPNGCIFFQDRYHMYYQHNPYAAVWGAMHWGHAASTDLVHWKHQPIALAPSETYDDHSQGGVFSGSAVEFGDDLAVLYTGTTNHGEGFIQTQCLAISRDGGCHFEKYEGNPVIRKAPAGVSSDFRDPKVFRHGDYWYTVLGASLGKGAWHGGEGCALLYRSKNLREWEYRGIPARSSGRYGSMWECPDLFPLDGKWVLTFSPMFMNNRQKTVYFVGEMDFGKSEFRIEGEGEIDWGGEYYAPQSLLDGKGRRVLLAWQNAWDWMPWWKDFGPTESEGWRCGMALPRLVSLDKKERIVSKPVEELESLRGGKKSLRGVEVGAEKVIVPCVDPVCFELLVEIDLEATTAKKLSLVLRASEEKQTVVTLDFVGKELVFNRSRSDNGYSHGSRSCALLLEDSICTLHVFSDTSSVEIFTDGGSTCMSHTIYPTHTGQRSYLIAEGGAVRIKSLCSWAMKVASFS
jgi:beta-fructofuranosidase